MNHRLSRTLQGIVGRDMIEGVIGKQAFCLGSSEKRVITAHEGDGMLVARQELAVTQGDCQLYSIIGLQGMDLRQMRCGFKVARGQRDDSITMHELAVETAIFPLPFGPLDPANALDNRQSCGDLNVCDLRNKEAVTGLITVWLPRLNELTNPSTAWLRDVVLDHGAGIKVVDGHN